MSKLLDYISALETENKKLRDFKNQYLEAEKAISKSCEMNIEELIIKLNSSNSSATEKAACRNKLTQLGYDPDLFDASSIVNCI